MTLNNAISNLTPETATKRPSMRGYIYKRTSAETTDEGNPAIADAIVLVDKEGSETAFPADGESGECTLDAALFGDLIADDWEVASRESYEKARVGAARW